MFGWFQNLKIGTRILACVLVPIAGLLFFAGTTMMEKYTTADELQKVGAVTDLAPTVSALVHELQKERGRSAGFIGSKGNSFADVLPAQRRDTDVRLKNLKTAFADFDVSAYDQSLADSAAEAFTKLSNLDAMRGSVDRFSVTVPEMAGYYTPTIMKLLGIVDVLHAASSNDAVSKRIGAYISFLQGKERAGRERAMGAAGFGAGEFKPAVYNNFVRLIGAQDIFFANFLLFASDGEAAFFADAMTNPAVDQVASMRKVAIASPQTGDLNDITNKQWFETITNKINLMKRVEDHIAGNLSGLAVTKADAAWSAFTMSAIITGILAMLTIVLATFIVRSITVPVSGLTEVMQRLADGDLAVTVDGTERGDEIGSMAKAVGVFKQNAVDMKKMEEERVEAEMRAANQKRSEMNQLADEFEAQVGGIVEAVSSQSAEMRATAESMSGTAEETSRQAASVAAASDQASANVQTVASATEEMTASVAEINRQVGDSVDIAARANNEAERTNATVQGLASAADKIGEIVNLISEIAEQTNLLALNATIEAARAGEAGKGFAVVASEVKSLATQTAKATEEIAAQINEIQSVSSKAVEAIGGIGKTINEISSIAQMISTAVGEQGAATREIAENTQQAATGTHEVTTTISEVTQAASETGAAAQQVLSSAADLSKQSESLRIEVDGFLAKVRSA